jgi:hypothetical protein
MHQDPRENCTFTYDHLRATLVYAREAGYRFITYPEATAAPDGPAILLRHDVDHSPRMALRLATIENELGIHATYFILPTDQYNAIGMELETFRGIAGLGHAIGIHYDPAFYRAHGLPHPGTALTDARMLAERLGVPVLAGARHNPEAPGERRADVSPLIDALRPDLRARFRYLSDSCQHWREGCVCRAISAADRPSLQVLIHPEWWSEDGARADVVLERIRDERIATAGQAHAATRALYASLEHLPTRHLFERPTG